MPVLAPWSAATDSRPLQPAFGVGEKLTYAVKWGPLRAGTAVMWVREIVDVRGRPCYHITSEAQSNAFFSLFYRVDDEVETWVDVETLVPLKHEKHLREGTYYQDEVIEFDHAARTATYSDGERVQFAPGVQDILSALYYVRSLKFPPKGPIFVENQTNKKNYRLEVKPLRHEWVNAPAGTFDCTVIEPYLKTTGLFKQKGRLWIWLSNDENRLPTKMKSQIKVGSITAVLEEVSLGSAPAEARLGQEGGAR